MAKKFMIKSTPKHSKNKNKKNLRHIGEYLDFVAWIALPTELRSPSTQRELAVDFGVGEDTLSEWKARSGFWDDVTDKRKEWGRERTPDVIHALFRRIRETGGASEVRLWMECVEGWQLPKPELKTESRFGDLERMTDAELHAEHERLSKGLNMGHNIYK